MSRRYFTGDKLVSVAGVESTMLKLISTIAAVVMAIVAVLTYLDVAKREPTAVLEKAEGATVVREEKEQPDAKKETIWVDE